jgi:hypothetical protein
VLSGWGTTPEHLRIRLSGGRTWWAHFEFTRINITPIILPKKIEDLREARASMSNRLRQTPASSVSQPTQSFGERAQIVAVDPFDDLVPLVVHGIGVSRSEERT